MAITFEKVSYIYFPKTPFEHKALDNINLNLENGKFYALVGETGSGKSTLVAHINALLLANEGSIRVNDLSWSKKDKKIDYKKIRKMVGLVFQFPEQQLFEESVLKDVMFGPKNFKFSEEEAKKSALEALKLVGIEESLFDKSPLDLSGGQKRRVAIAGILALNPDIVILDEPTAGLDPSGCKEILAIFKKLNKEYGKTIILITHDMNVVYEYADEVIVLNKGKVAFKGEKEALFSDFESLKRLSLKEPDIVRFTRILQEKGFKIASSFTIEDLVISLVKEV